MPDPFDITDAEYEIARKAVEDVLIDHRDNRISLLGRGNGLVKDGKPSHIIRLGMENALRIALKAIAESRGQRSQ